MADAPVWVGDTLWPGARISSGWFGRGRHRLVAVPSTASPRRLIPWTPAAAVAAAGRATDDRSRRQALVDGLGALGLLVVGPLGRSRRLMVESAGPALVEHLRDEIDPTIRHAMIMCGPVRANQKPVLQLLDRFGRTRLFVKVSWNALTRQLLDAERRALEHLATLDELDVTVPRVLGSGTFGAGTWLATSPVGVEHRTHPSRPCMLQSARAIEASTDEWTGGLGESSFLTKLAARAADLPSSGPAIAALADRHGDRQVTLRAAHGDFVPWNILSGAPRPAVWDWERYATDVPAGYDRLHYALQVELHRADLPTVAAVESVHAQLDELLPEL
ncbi:MAG: hypothetical protein AB7U39_24510, partial [Ilumatobacteraceae bacterium]